MSRLDRTENRVQLSPPDQGGDGWSGFCVAMISVDAETVTGGAIESVGFAGGGADFVELATGAGGGVGAGASNTEGIPKSCTLVVTIGSLG
jgi:hypothetical protein